MKVVEPVPIVVRMGLLSVVVGIIVVIKELGAAVVLRVLLVTAAHLAPQPTAAIGTSSYNLRPLVSLSSPSLDQRCYGHEDAK